jgi:hypothetical protein
MRTYAESVFQETNALYPLDGTPAQNVGDFHFKDMYEPTFRDYSYNLFVDWAHMPQILKHHEFCRERENMQTCIENWFKIRSFWDSSCCKGEPGAPCHVNGQQVTSTTENSSIPVTFDDAWLKSVGLPRASDRTLPNKIMLQCLEGCAGVVAFKAPIISTRKATENLATG